MLPELKNTEMEIAEGLIACEAPDCEAFEVETLGATLGAIFKGGPQVHFSHARNHANEEAQRLSFCGSVATSNT